MNLALELIQATRYDPQLNNFALFKFEMGNHWTLAAAYPSTLKVVYWDPMEDGKLEAEQWEKLHSFLQQYVSAGDWSW
ncbi:hypothetical protein HaLaN_28222, partial [Haematococcus lacustris]